jgi:predicted nucleic acid-binding protein
LIYLLDSGPLGRLVDGDNLLDARLRRYGRAGDVLGAPPVVRAEMFAAVSSDRRRRARLHRVLSGFAGDTETADDGRRAGEILGRLRSRPTEVSLVDAMLAAVAERASAVVLTDDVGDFGRMRDEAGSRAVYLAV